jgi:hypothetical protein
MGNTNSLLNSLKIVLAARNLSGFDDVYLQYEIEQAIAEINRCRRFTPTAKSKYDTKYEYLIIPMCVAAIAKIGAEGQNTHSENGIQRTYGSSIDYPKELLSQIIPLLK